MANYGNKFRKVQSGQRRVLPAALWNDVLAAVEFVQSLRDSGGALVGSNPGRLCVVPVKNMTANDRSRWDVLGLGDVVHTPSDAEEEFRNQPLLKGEAPALADHLGKFCVLAEPLGQNDVGWAVVAGVVPVKLSQASGEDWYSYADIDAGVATSLKRRPYGAAQVLWRAEGSDEQWAVVRLGNPAGELIYLGTMADDLNAGSSANANLSTPAGEKTQVVYDGFLTAGQKLPSGKKVVVAYRPHDQKFWAIGGEASNQTVITDWQVLDTSQKIQIKTRTLYVGVGADESDWTDKYTGTTCPSE
jgi:hypothetical protein